MRFPNDTAFHLRMAALVIGSLFLEQLARTRLSNWSSPEIGIVTFVLGLAWVALFAAHHGRALLGRVKALELELARVTELAEALADDQRRRRSLPPL